MNALKGYMFKRVVLDIEANGLLDTITKIWMVVIRCIDTDEVKYWINGDQGYKEFLKENTELIVGHNLIGYDLIALRKIDGWVPPASIKIHDTMLMSQSLDYKRFPSNKHSLAAWGEFLGEPKGDFSEFDKYSDEMLKYCIQDTNVNVKIYKFLRNELKVKSEKRPLIKSALRNEHTTAKFCAEAEYLGWRFDRPAGEALLKAMEDKMRPIEDHLNPKLQLMLKSDREIYKPKWKKTGEYYLETSKYFNITPESGRDEVPPVCGPYSRVEFIVPNLGNMDSVKDYLYSIGWVPDDWNWKKINGKFVKQSPKLTTSSLEKLGQDGLMIDEYYTIRSRHAILTGWLEQLDSKDRLHGSCFTIGTPTGRARHDRIVNVPGADSIYGPEMRALFITEPGNKIIGADSAGNQMRALLHYLKNEAYTKLVLEGDVHTENANILTNVYGKTVSRSDAKPFLYAFLFGAGGEKLGLILSGKRNAALGNKAKREFIKGTPGLAELTTKIQERYHKTESIGHAYIMGLDGNRIYCDSPHKALNYLLQRFEAITMKAAINYFVVKMEEAGIWYEPKIFYHDEVEVECKAEDADRVKQILHDSLIEGGKEFGVNLLGAGSAIGDNWYEVH